MVRTTLYRLDIRWLAAAAVSPRIRFVDLQLLCRESEQGIYPIRHRTLSFVTDTVLLFLYYF